MKKIEDFQLKKNKVGIERSQENFHIMKTALDTVGKGFCLAKWTQVTMHLGNGLTHSCHHPVAHKIPIEELEKNPSALHNTSYKKEQRKAMLNGERPNECDYCWKIEDNTSEFSDRVYKSMDSYSIENYNDIVNYSGEENVYPRYLEVSFNRTCNFKCAYCGPDFSSKWAEEIVEHGFYKLPHGYGYNWSENAHIPHKDDNPYIDAFWKWWPEAKKHLQVLRITGGEPLLSKNTFELLESLKEHKEPNLELSINTNGNPPKKLWDRFINLIKYLTENKCIKRFTLFTSAEAYGKQCEYIRYGMDFDQFQQNIEEFLDKTSSTRVVFMSAFNILSLPTFTQFLEYVLSLKLKFNYNGYFHWVENQKIDIAEKFIRDTLPNAYKKDKIRTFNERHSSDENFLNDRVGIDIPYVRSPDFLDVQIASRDLVENYLLDAMHFVYKNSISNEYNESIGFTNSECAKLKRIFSMTLGHLTNHETDNGQTNDLKTKRQRDRFQLFIKEYDKRRGTNFLETFPEFNEFYSICELENLDLKNKK